MDEESAPPSPVPGPSSAPDVMDDNSAVAKEDGDEGILKDEDLGVQVRVSKVAYVHHMQSNFYFYFASAMVSEVLSYLLSLRSTTGTRSRRRS